MTDRELLELAAKAAGYERNSAGPIGPCEWNPLEDDGDALRLAVDLRLDCCFFNDDIEIISWAGNTGDMTVESDNGDRASCVRRAIVRAAAEIGRNIK